jgi:hypothetical protein
MVGGSTELGTGVHGIMEEDTLVIGMVEIGTMESGMMVTGRRDYLKVVFGY